MFEEKEVVGFLKHQEGIKVNIMGNEINIFISYSKPTIEEIRTFKDCPIQFGVSFGLGVLVFAYKIGELDWQDLLYSYHYSQWLHEIGEGIFVEPSIEYLKENEALPLNMYLVDSDTNEIIHKRSFNLPNKLKREVIRGLKEQKYSSIPILNTLSSSTKIQAFECSKDFLESQPVEAIVEGLEKYTFNF